MEGGVSRNVSSTTSSIALLLCQCLAYYRKKSLFCADFFATDRAYFTLDLPEENNNEEGPNQIDEENNAVENGKNNLQNL